MRERSFQFFELLWRPMHFDTGQTRHLQHFLQQRADIVQMSKQTVALSYASRQKTWSSLMLNT